MNSSPRSSTPHRSTAVAHASRKCYGAEGCPAFADGRRCGETRNLQIIQEFKHLYETKMKEIDDAASGDCVQAKINLQQEWIRDLTDQNEMLVRVVEELEVEAAERVMMLEDKLQQSAKCACEHEKLAKEKEKKANELQEKITRLSARIDENEEAKKAYIQYEELKKSMLDMRDALTVEVAEKHDTILSLRRELRMLEDQCRKADQQTNFKDDIIKELRKEIKQLKLQQRCKKTRSPRTLKRTEQRYVHSSRTDPDTNIKHIKDGTIVIKDTTVGDSVATQVIKEKYSDPTNQTVVYICESVPRRQRSKSRGDFSRLEATPVGQSKSNKEDLRNCEVSTGVSRGYSMDNSRDITLDCPRNAASEDVSRDSENFIQRNFFTYPSIRETCIKYSKDILEMLNNHGLDDKKKVLEGGKIEETNSIPIKRNEVDKGRYDMERGDPNDLQLKDFKRNQREPIKNDLDTFLRNTLTRRERYFLETYRDECKSGNKTEEGRGVDLNSDDVYLKKIHQYQIHPNENHADVTYKSNGSQTMGSYQLDKDTQTSQLNLCDCDTTCDLSVSSSYIRRKSGNEIRANPDEFDRKKDNSGDQTECILPPNIINERYNVEDNVNVTTDEIWNNPTMGSDEVIFEEADIGAYSTPMYEETFNYYRHPEMLIPTDGVQNRDFDRYLPPRVIPVRHCVLTHSPPPQQASYMPHQLRQTKMLSPRTLRKLPPPRVLARPHQQVPLSLRSRSLPICTEVYASRHDLHRPVRLHQVRGHPMVHANDFADVAVVVGDSGARKKIPPDELRGFVELSGREKVREGQCFEHWSTMNNTF